MRNTFFTVRSFLLLALITIGNGTAVCRSAPPEKNEELVIVSPQKASPLERFSAREVRRYLYLRTERLLPILAERDKQAGGGWEIIVARKDQPILSKLVPENENVRSLSAGS